jgi:hemoglobin-like flavoprotein
MQTAVTELRDALAKPYYHFVVNENLDDTVETINSIAHRHDKFTTADHSYRVWAERLLEELQAGA